MKGRDSDDTEQTLSTGRFVMNSIGTMHCPFFIIHDVNLLRWSRETTLRQECNKEECCACVGYNMGGMRELTSRKSSLSFKRSHNYWISQMSFWLSCVLNGGSTWRICNNTELIISKWKLKILCFAHFLPNGNCVKWAWAQDHLISWNSRPVFLKNNLICKYLSFA